MKNKTFIVIYKNSKIVHIYISININKYIKKYLNLLFLLLL